ncbi:helicase-related protein [Vibrio sp. PP-XX7]
MKHKVALLTHILREQSQKAIIFVKTRERLAELRSQLEKALIPCAWIQGEMPQDRRNNAISRFREGQVNVLLATDVAARGIDIPDITHVINFDLPRSADVFVHRVGRTARAGKKGIAISLVESHDQQMMDRICRYTKEEIKERFIDGLRPQNKKPTFKKKKKSPAKPSTGKNKINKKVKQTKKVTLQNSGSHKIFLRDPLHDR